MCVICLQGEMRICVLPTHVSYDAPWPVRKVPLRCTPHCVAYHIDSKVRPYSHSRNAIIVLCMYQRVLLHAATRVVYQSCMRDV